MEAPLDLNGTRRTKGTIKKEGFASIFLGLNRPPTKKEGLGCQWLRLQHSFMTIGCVGVMVKL